MGEVISQNCHTSPFFKLREKWFYIGYIERIFEKTITSLHGQNFSLFQICRITPDVLKLKKYHINGSALSLHQNNKQQTCNISHYIK